MRVNVVLGVWLAVALLLMAGALGAQQEARVGEQGEARMMTLREAVRAAMEQNSEVLLARLEQQSAMARVRQVADPFSLKLGVGSGLAYSSGFPMNVGGSGPSLVNAQANMTLLDRAQRLRVEEAKQRARVPEVLENERQQQAALEVLRLYLNAESLGQRLEALENEAAALERVAAIRRAQMEEGRLLPVDAKQAAAELARVRYQMRDLRTSLWNAEAQLAYVLGMEPGARVRVARENRTEPAAPATAAEAGQRAVAGSLELARLETELAANRFRKQAAGAARWPVVRLVSQYSMFARFNNYDDFYNRFERHNGQVGASFELPLFVGSAARAEASEADVETEKLRVQAEQIRRRVTLQSGLRYREWEDAKAYHELAALELETARERLSVLLARVAEGKSTLPELEGARADEARKWAEFYQSRTARERAAYELLNETGDLLALFR